MNKKWYYWQLLDGILCIATLVMLLGATTSCTPIRKMNSDILEVGFSSDIEQTLTQLGSNRDKISYLLEYCQEHHSSDIQRVLAAAGLIEKWARTHELDLEYGKALYWLAYIENQESPAGVGLNEALANVKICTEIFQELDDSLWIAKALNLRAFLHYNMYEEKKGWEFNEQARQVLASIPSQGSMISTTWGDVFRANASISAILDNNLDTVLWMLHQSYEHYLAAADSFKLALTLLNHGIVCRKGENWTNSTTAFQKSIELYEGLGLQGKLAEAHLEHASMLADRFKLSEQEEWFLLSNEALRKGLLFNPKNKTEYYFQLATNYNNQGLYTKHELYYDTAANYYKEALELCVAEQNLAYLDHSAREVAKICADIGSLRCRSLLLKTVQAYHTILEDTKESVQMASERMEQYQQKVAAAEQRRLLWTSVIVIFVLLLGFILIFLLSRIRVLRQQSEMRLQALRSQMHPHFISNSLNAIDSLISQNRNDEASEYIIDFSRLCRQIIDYSQQHLISLSQELETLGYYLSLEKLRMKEKLIYEIKIERQIDVQSIKIPPMILQPYVENAINHGIHNLSGPGQLVITIKKSSTKPVLEYVIEDNGVGREKALSLQNQSTARKRTSYGIKITQTRIETLKKVINGSVVIKDLYDSEGRASGTQVVILLPLIES